MLFIGKEKQRKMNIKKRKKKIIINCMKKQKDWWNQKK